MFNFGFFSTITPYLVLAVTYLLAFGAYSLKTNDLKKVKEPGPKHQFTKNNTNNHPIDDHNTYWFDDFNDCDLSIKNEVPENLSLGNIYLQLLDERLIFKQFHYSLTTRPPPILS